MPDGKTRIHVPPIVASAFCIKPRGLLTKVQCEKVDDLKEASTEFAAMRALAMRFRGLLRRGNIELLDTWLQNAASSGIHAMRRIAATLRRDTGAVRNANVKPWSNG
ncbi:transposase [Acidisoma silvae]|uniref:Transposase n=1 Tax=Acidisoma silvae TaxID=2802396 RepID=A0A964E1V7_9PROT|nr:transposase [Acidisoma silvae]